MNLPDPQIIALILFFFVGLGSKHLKLLSATDAPILLKVVMNVCLPALTILAIYRVQLAADMLLVPLCAMLVIVLLYFISSFIGSKLNLPRPTFGSFLVGTMIINTAFALPFFKAIGNEHLARASLYDIGNTFLIFTFSYYNAIKYGDNEHTDKIQWSKFLKLPPLYAMVVAVGIKVSQITIPSTAIKFLETAGAPTGMLMMLALGLVFAPKAAHLSKALIAVFLRMGGGLALGLLLSLIFGLEGIPRTVVIVCSSMPVGFNTLVLADRENMDRGFAATMVSVSTLIALFYIPTLIFFFG